MAGSREMIFIINADSNMRQSLTHLCETTLCPVTACASAAEFLADFQPAQPCCLIMDLGAPDMPGVEFLREVRRRQWRLPVIFTAAQVDVSTAVSAMRLGAVDICLQPVEPTVLVSLVRRTLALAAQQERNFHRIAGARRLLASLSPRELQLFALVLDCKSNKEMGAHLGISPRTVEQHRAHITRKLGVDRVADMVRLGLLASHETIPSA